MRLHRMLLFVVEGAPLSSSSSSSTTTYSDEEHRNEDDNIYLENQEEDLLFFPLIQSLIHGQRRQRVENYLQVVDAWTELEFQQHMRLSRQTANHLIDDLAHSGFIPQNTAGIPQIPARLSMLIFLWFMANTEPLRTLSDRFDVSISSVFRIVRRVVAWLLTKLNGTIQWPQGDRVLTTSQGFFQHRNISNVIGAIDCTHIRIEKPSENAQNYCNQKKFLSINLQAVVDSNTQFINISCGEPGSLHDARVFRRSSLYETASVQPEVIFPQRTFLIGYSAYPSSQWLIPPFRDNGHLTDQQREFNFLHSSTRMFVERAFGLLKGRFRRIKFFNEYKNIHFVINIITAACILHNYCIAVNDEADVYDIDNQLGVNNIAGEEIGNPVQADRRMQLFRELYPDE